MHRNGNKNRRLKQLSVSNMSTCSENGEDIFIIFGENMRQGNCIVAIPCSDLSFCFSLNCSVYSLFSIPWQPRFPKCLYRNRKVDKNAEFSNTIGPFPIFYGGEWDTCMFGVFTAGFSGEKI